MKNRVAFAMMARGLANVSSWILLKWPFTQTNKYQIISSTQLKALLSNADRI